MSAKLTSVACALMALAALGLAGRALAESYGEWTIVAKDRSGLGLTWSGAFANSGSVGFICGKKPRSTLAIIAPPPALYANAREVVGVVVVPDGTAGRSLQQDWGNGGKYVYQKSPDVLAALTTHLRSQQQQGVEHVSFIFSGAADGSREQSDAVLAIRVSLDNFATAHDAWQRQCAALQ